MSTPTITQKSLYDYSALPILRDTTVAKATGVTITEVDTANIDLTFLLQEAETSGNHVFRLAKPSLRTGSPVDPRLDTALRALHALATALFNNLSHVLELPWEKYLAEMHEYTAPGNDQLCIARNPSDLANAWSTLTLLIDPAQPNVCHVAYGEALSVLSESQIEPAASLPPCPGASRLVAYYVRLNDATYYTRTAGALMTPLSDKEYSDRKTVKELCFINSN